MIAGFRAQNNLILLWYAVNLFILDHTLVESVLMVIMNAMHYSNHANKAPLVVFDEKERNTSVVV